MSPCKSLDRILGYKDPIGSGARAACDALALDLHAHLGMIFHRVLPNQIKGRASEYDDSRVLRRR